MDNLLILPMKDRDLEDREREDGAYEHERAEVSDAGSEREGREISRDHEGAVGELQGGGGANRRRKGRWGTEIHTHDTNQRRTRARL